MTKDENLLMAQLQLKADMFDYLCWLEQVNKPAEIRDEHLCLASDGTTCWGKDYGEAVRVAMEYDKGLQDATTPNDKLTDLRETSGGAERKHAEEK